MKSGVNDGVMKEADIRPTALMADKEKSLQWDVEFLLSSKGDWVKVDCPACGSKQHHLFGEKNGFSYAECDACSSVFTNPRPSLDTLHRFYSQSKNYDYWNKYIFPQTEIVRRKNLFRPRAQKVADFANSRQLKGGVLLEVGAAFGWFCEEIKSFNVFERVIAVEPTPGLAETCRKKGIETIESPIEKVNLDDLVDIVVSFEVIEHLFSPEEFIRQCSRLLKPNGVLVLSCPNVKGFDVGTLGINSGTFDHEHLNYFHPRSLGKLLIRLGFNILTLETPGKLDVDIVKNRVMEGKIDVSGNFLLSELFNRDDVSQLAAFQKFLSENLMSSHMWVIAEKLEV